MPTGNYVECERRSVPQCVGLSLKMKTPTQPEYTAQHGTYIIRIFGRKTKDEEEYIIIKTKS